MRGRSWLGAAGCLLAMALCLGWGAASLLAQSSPAQAPKPDDNPFPGSSQPQDAKPGQNANRNEKSGQTGKPAEAQPQPSADKAGDNAFPGEDPNVPVIPYGAGAGSAADGGGDAYGGRTPRRDSDPDGDPVRSPDPPGRFASDAESGDRSDDGFASSRSGLKQLPAEDDSDGKPGKSVRNKTRAQVVKEDVDVGSYYLERKDWKGARSRFADAFALDGENPDAVFGLAEAERHLAMEKEAEEHYKLFLSYDPDSKHGREARKALEELQQGEPSAAASKPKR